MATDEEIDAWQARVINELTEMVEAIERGVVVSCMIGWRVYDPNESDPASQNVMRTNLHSRPDVTPDTLLALWISIDERVRKLYAPQPDEGSTRTVRFDAKKMDA